MVDGGGVKDGVRIQRLETTGRVDWGRVHVRIWEREVRARRVRAVPGGDHWREMMRVCDGDVLLLLLLGIGKTA